MDAVPSTCRPDGCGSGGAEAPGGAGPQVVAFDFDGTLTTRDSFTAFLRWRSSRASWAIGLLRLLPDLLAYVARRDRGALKAAGVRVFLRGVERSALEGEAQGFAAQASCGLLRPDALAEWERHGRAGRLRVIVTASPEEIVAPFARRLGADVLIGSRLAWTGEGRVGEGLDGPNCRGAEKVRRLRERFGAGLDVLDAYGDTGGDLDMLAFARRGHMRTFKGRAQPPSDPAAPRPSRRTRSPGG